MNANDEAEIRAGWLFAAQAGTLISRNHRF
jgi:hypothetical protein